MILYREPFKANDETTITIIKKLKTRSHSQRATCIPTIDEVQTVSHPAVDADNICLYLRGRKHSVARL